MNINCWHVVVISDDKNLKVVMEMKAMIGGRFKDQEIHHLTQESN